MKKATILLGGDFVITEGIFGDDILIEEALIEEFNKSDFNILNLESPVTNADKNYCIEKTGPHIKGDKLHTKKYLNCLNIDLVTLANNHVLDYGEKGLKDTLQFCDENKIDYVGAGKDLYEAKKPFRQDVNGKKISFLNFAENEWSSASKDSSGANPFDLIENIKQIKEEKKQANFVIVIIHGGHEYFNLPSPRMVKEYRFYAENGADIIIGHHPHCISGYELHNEVPIYYSLGNFLFTLPSSKPDWYLGALLKIEISEDDELNCELIPVKQEKNNFKLALVKGKDYLSVMDRITNYSKIIVNPLLLNKEWEGFISKVLDTKLVMFSSLSYFRYFNTIIKRLGVIKLFISKRILRNYLNLFRCESHLELSKAIISKQLKN